MNRIVIVGATGTGKTTLAFRLAAKLDIPATDLDDLHWCPGWIEAPPDDFRRDVDKATAGGRWILVGNYPEQKDVSWPRADTLVWLDYGLTRTFSQLARRTFRRILSQDEVCNGNRESLRMLFSKDSIILWLLRSYGQKRQEYGSVFDHPERHPQFKKLVRLKNPMETEKFLTSL